MLLRPDEISRWSNEIVGGKAWGLANLASVARVPDFRVIVPDENLKTDIQRLTDEFINTACTYAVRSSAAAEDSGSASYAGLFLTILNVTTNEIPQCIARVIESRNATRVKVFQEAIGMHSSAEPKVSVVVQEMVAASASGVALSFAPNTDRQHALVEAIFGLGEPLVGGEIPPDSWTVDRKSQAIKQYRTGHQVWKQSVEGRVLIQNYERNIPKLDAQQLSAVLDLLFSVELHLSLPAADLEFCFDGSVLYALQARPLLSF